jgi:hypothetical protein
MAPAVVGLMTRSAATTEYPKNNGHGQGDGTSVRNWQALVLGHRLA